MMTRYTNAHEPAMTVQEAAMLPAIAASNPGRLAMPLNASHFIPVTMAEAETEATAEVRRGSAAGRAILHADGVNLPGVSRMGCRRGRRRMIGLEPDCDDCDCDDDM